MLQIPRSNFAQLEESTGEVLAVGMQLWPKCRTGPPPSSLLSFQMRRLRLILTTLAGKALTFSVEVVDLRKASEEEISHGHAHGPGGVQH